MFGKDARLTGAQHRATAAFSPAVGDYIPGLGYLVYKVDSGATQADSLFVVTGTCLITSLFGIVSVAIGGTVTSASVNTVTGDIALASSATVLDGAAAGVVALVEGDGTALVASAGAVASGIQGLVIVDDDSIERNFDATAGAGTMEWFLTYIPLQASSSIASAA